MPSGYYDRIGPALRRRSYGYITKVLIEINNMNLSQNWKHMFAMKHQVVIPAQAEIQCLCSFSSLTSLDPCPRLRGGKL